MTALSHDTADAVPVFRSANSGAAFRPLQLRPLTTPKPPTAIAKVLALRPMEKITTKGFLAIVGALMTVSALLVLALNTMLAQGSFARYDLMTRKAEVTLRETALSEQLMQVESPAQLTKRARSLGMVPNTAPGYIDARTGVVTGAAEPAQVPISGPGLSAVPGTTTVAGAVDQASGPGGETAVGLRPGSTPATAAAATSAAATAGATQSTAGATQSTAAANAATAGEGLAAATQPSTAGGSAGGESGLGLRAAGGAR